MTAPRASRDNRMAPSTDSSACRLCGGMRPPEGRADAGAPALRSRRSTAVTLAVGPSVQPGDDPTDAGYNRESSVDHPGCWLWVAVPCRRSYVRGVTARRNPLIRVRYDPLWRARALGCAGALGWLGGDDFDGDRE